ncbi:ATP-binding protein [Nonomuraea maritima]
MTEQAAQASIDQACRMLRLPSIRAQFPDLAEAAARDQMSYLGFLAELLMAECDDRARRRSERRIKAAQFPRDKSLRAFDFEANPNIDPATIHTLATCEWVKKGQPLCLIGDSGTGKSHLLIALGTEAAMKGYRVRYTLATKLVNELVEAADEKVLAKTVARYGRVDLLCIDELGYMELDRHGANFSSRCSPNARRKTAWPSPPTSPSLAGPAPLPTHVSAPRSSTASPSPATSSRPAPTPTVWPRPEPEPNKLADHITQRLTVLPERSFRGLKPHVGDDDSRAKPLIGFTRLSAGFEHRRHQWRTETPAMAVRWPR